MKNWFSITAKGSGKAEIVLFDEIGLYGITAKNFYDQLKALGDVRNITLRVNSVGGDVFDGLAIFNMLKNHPARVDVWIDGIAASIASVICMSGDHITMPGNSFMFVHDPFAVVIGDAENMREMASDLDKIAKSLVSTYMAKTGKTEEEVKQWMAEDRWFSAAEALEVGLCDEVVEPMAIAARFDLSRFKNAPAALLQPPEPAVDIEAIRAQVRAEIEAEHVTAVADARAEAIEGEKQRAADDVKRIVALCFQACVPDIAQKFISEGRTVAWVEDRLKHAEAIKVRCAAARMFNRAAGYITANLTPEEVTDSLMAIKLAMDGPEISNVVGPETYFGDSTAGGPARPKPKLMKVQDYYDLRNGKKKPGDELIEALAAKLKESGALR